MLGELTLFENNWSQITSVHVPRTDPPAYGCMRQDHVTRDRGIFRDTGKQNETHLPLLLDHFFQTHRFQPAIFFPADLGTTGTFIPTSTPTATAPGAQLSQNQVFDLSQAATILVLMLEDAQQVILAIGGVGRAPHTTPVVMVWWMVNIRARRG